MSHPRADLSKEVTNFVSSVIVAGGSGMRFGTRKQFALLGGRPVLEHTLETVLAVSDQVIVVVPDDAVTSTHEALSTRKDRSDGHVLVVAGGATRAASVRAGLAAVEAEASVVLVHDAARPLATTALFDRVIDSVTQGAAAAIPVVPVTDSIRHVDGRVVDRTSLRAVQTPQGFRAEVLRSAHASGADATDDATLVGDLGYDVATVDGEPENRKLTVSSDLTFAQAIVSERAKEPRVTNS